MAKSCKHYHVFKDLNKHPLQILMCSLLVLFVITVILCRSSHYQTYVFSPQVFSISDQNHLLIPYSSMYEVESENLSSGSLLPVEAKSLFSVVTNNFSESSDKIHIAPTAMNHDSDHNNDANGGNVGVEDKKCDIFDGRWVYDESWPRYQPGSCPFIDSSFNCYKNGRTDLNYTKLRWQPKGCTLPRLDGKKMLRLLRGKRLAVVGDSLNRNMWESLICMLRQSLKNKNRVYEVSGRSEFKTDNSYAFKFPDYNCSVEFFRSTFLVRESSRVDSKGIRRETLRLDLIEETSDSYKDADVIIYNSGHWWTHAKTTEGKYFYQEGKHVHPQLSSYEAYEKAMKTWASWIEKNINTEKTRVFFRGYSWSHFSGGQWDSGGNCDGEIEPITNDKHLGKYLKLNNIIESVINDMKVSVDYLNITRMTDYRKDAHPSVYRMPPTKRKPGDAQDCAHWCLPGVPDAWNEIMYAMLLRERSS